jgi:hypothetical protein
MKVSTPCSKAVVDTVTHVESETEGANNWGDYTFAEFGFSMMPVVTE